MSENLPIHYIERTKEKMTRDVEAEKFIWQNSQQKLSATKIRKKPSHLIYVILWLHQVGNEHLPESGNKTQMSSVTTSFYFWSQWNEARKKNKTYKDHKEKNKVIIHKWYDWLHLKMQKNLQGIKISKRI